MLQGTLPTILHNNRSHHQKNHTQNALSHIHTTNPTDPEFNNVRYSYGEPNPTTLLKAPNKLSHKTIIQDAQHKCHAHHKSHHIGNYNMMRLSNPQNHSKIKRRISTAGNNKRFPQDFFSFNERQCVSTKNSHGNSFRVKKNLFEQFMKKKLGRCKPSKARLEQKEEEMTPKFRHELKSKSSSHEKYQEKNEFLFEEPVEMFLKEKTNKIDIQPFKQTSNDCLKLEVGKENTKKEDSNSKVHKIYMMKKIKQNLCNKKRRKNITNLDNKQNMEVSLTINGKCNKP